MCILIKSGLFLSTSCQQNLLAEKEAVASWILVGGHLVKNSEQFLCYTCTTIQYLNHIKLSKFTVHEKFLSITLSWLYHLDKTINENALLFQLKIEVEKIRNSRNHWLGRRWLLTICSHFYLTLLVHTSNANANTNANDVHTLTLNVHTIISWIRCTKAMVTKFWNLKLQCCH